MTIDPNIQAPATDPGTVSAIENELPAYRAISPRAIVALILGILAVLSFASWYFLSLAVAAVLVGYLADRKIQRFPNVLTGRGLAQAGMGLGLIFGLTAVTITTVQGVLRTNQAKAFSRIFINAAKKGTFDQIVWFSHHPDARALSTPEKLTAEMEKQQGGPMMIDQKFGPHRALKKALGEPGADIHFKSIESHGEDGLNPFAAVVLEVDSPQAKNPAEKEQHALAFMKGTKTRTGRYEWWVESLQFPYKPSGVPFQPPAKHADDGHGHSH